MHQAFKKSLFTVLLITCATSPIHGFEGIGDLCNKAKATLMRTHAGFHISRFYNKMMHGSSFTFHQIAGDRAEQGLKTIHCGDSFISYDASGAIRAINDGKKTPLVLGGIPDNQNHIEQLKKAFPCTDPRMRFVGIFTLNERWECDAAGLSKLVKNNNQLVQFTYTTPDFGAPLFIDLIRAVHDLENRDNCNQQVALVHCKAGRGRSATIVGAYLAHVIHKAGAAATTDQVETYLQSRRPQVGINKQQKQVLTQFITELHGAGTFEALYAQYKTAVEHREQELDDTDTTPWSPWSLSKKQALILAVGATAGLALGWYTHSARTV